MGDKVRPKFVLVVECVKTPYFYAENLCGRKNLIQVMLAS